MDKKYRVIFLALIKNEKDFNQGMSKLGVSPAAVKQIINKAPVVLKGNMSLGDARQYADAVFFAGGRINIQEHGFFKETRSSDEALAIKTLENFTMCPECGHKQLKAEACIRCGEDL